MSQPMESRKPVHSWLRPVKRIFGPYTVTLWAVLGLLALGAVLRLWGLDFGLPNLTRPDENHLSKFVVDFIMRSFFEGHPDLNPHFFHYPSLFIYLLTAVFSVYYFIGYWLGWFPDGMAFWAQYHNDWTVFHLLERAMSAVFGIASIPLVFLLGKYLSKSRRVGLAAAFLFAVTYLHVRDSHFGVTDTTCTFLGMSSLWLTLVYYRTGSLKTLYWASAVAGLAATTKYPLGLVMLSVYVAYWLRQRRAGYSLGQLFSNVSQLKTLLTMTLIVFGVFFAGSPYILLAPREFYQDFVVEQFDAILNTNFINMDPGWLYHLRFSLWYGLGPLYEIAALVGTLWAFRRHRGPVHAIVLVYMIAFYLVNASTRYVFVRYMIPLIPLLAVYTAWLLTDLAMLLAKRLDVNPEAGTQGVRWRMTAMLAGLVLLVGAHSIRMSLGIDWLLMQKDTRTLGREWLIQRLRPGDAVGIGLVFSHIDLPSYYQRYFLSPRQGPFVPGQGPHYLFEPKASYSGNATDRNERYITTFSDADTLRKLGIRYVSLGWVPLSFYTLPPQELPAIEHDPNYREVAHFVPFDPPAVPQPKETYDQIDGFFIPFSDFTGMTHPGPDIRIFEVLPATSSIENTHSRE